MSTKDFKAGMAAGAKPFGDKLDQLAGASEKGINDIREGIDGVHDVVDVILDDLSAQEKKRLYDLNTVVDISELDDTEKEYLCAVLFAVAARVENPTQEQQKYLRSLKAYLSIVNVQRDIDLSSIENIESITTQKAIMQTVMEFLFLGYQSHGYMDDYEDIFDYFSVNHKGVREIQDGINAMYQHMGLDGIAEHYGVVAEPTITASADNSPDANADTMLTRAERAFLIGNFEEAYHLLSFLAGQGNGRAMYFLGEIYATEYAGVVEKDLEKAREWRQKGAEVGDILSELKLAIMDGSAAEQQIADKVLALAKQGDVFAMHELGIAYTNGYGMEADTGKGVYWLQQSASAGYVRSLNALGETATRSGNHQSAVRYFKAAADRNYAPAIRSLAKANMTGQGTEENIEEALRLFELSAGMDSSSQVAIHGEVKANTESVYEDKRLVFDGYLELNGRLELRNCLIDMTEASKIVQKETIIDIADNAGELQMWDCIILNPCQRFIDGIIGKCELHNTKFFFTIDAQWSWNIIVGANVIENCSFYSKANRQQWQGGHFSNLFEAKIAKDCSFNGFNDIPVLKSEEIANCAFSQCGKISGQKINGCKFTDCGEIRVEWEHINNCELSNVKSILLDESVSMTNCRLTDVVATSTIISAEEFATISRCEFQNIILDSEDEDDPAYLIDGLSSTSVENCSFSNCQTSQSDLQIIHAEELTGKLKKRLVEYDIVGSGCKGLDTVRRLSK